MHPASLGAGFSQVQDLPITCSKSSENGRCKSHKTPTTSVRLGQNLLNNQGLVYHLFFRFGGHSVSETPDPIPNSAVKRHSADGTASQDVGE